MRDERGVAGDEAEARARRAAPRAPCSKRPTSVCSGPSGPGSPQRRSSSASSSVLPSGADGSGGFGTCASSASRSASAAASSASSARSSSFTPASSSSCSGVGLPFSFSFARSSSTCGTSARQRSSAASSASKRSRGALAARAQRGTRPGRRGRREGRSCRRALEAPRARQPTPSSEAGGHTQSATAFTRACAFSTAIAVAGPLDEVEVVLAVAERDRPLTREAEPLARGTRAPSPSRRRAVANSRKFGSDFVTQSRPPKRVAHAARRATSSSSGSPTQTIFVGGSVEPRADVADRVERDLLEVRVRLGLRV